MQAEGMQDLSSEGELRVPYLLPALQRRQVPIYRCTPTQRKVYGNVT